MKRKLLFFVFILICSFNTPVNGQQSKEDSLQAAFLNAKGDTTVRSSLYALEDFYSKDPNLSPDVCFRKLEFILKKKGDPNLNYHLLKYWVVFMHTTDSVIESKKYLYEYLEQCRLQTDNIEYAYTLTWLSQIENYSGNYNESFKLMLSALDYARDTLKDKVMTGEVYLAMGVFYNDQRDTLKAIEYNKLALKEMAEVNQVSSMAAVSNNLAMQYSDLKQYDSAAFYYRQSIRLFHLSVNDPKLRVPLINFAEVFRLTNQYDSAFTYSKEAIKNAIAIGDSQSLGFAYWQIAKNHRDIGKLDNAAQYFQLAKDNIEMNNPEASLIVFYPDLAAFYTLQGNYKSAYEYLQRTIKIKDLVFNEENNRVLKEMDIKYQAGQKEKEILKQEEQIKRQRIISYSVIAIAAFFLVMIFFVYRSYRLKQKANIIITNEKKRSDDLLLNILPAEVAEELKAKGAADAKHFDDVTVMFTDFKGFTQISEKLTPAELVAEIHSCFKAFDNIIGKHNIEKIKTIGDAYMCAGGLPVVNKTNAVDMVEAALEIQEFMERHLQQRQAEGKEIFEIRIGIHTGPVVAGIVGVKKFAYDIWGDTVNIASRMESSGEAGKVNISGSTYELVKDKFICKHRGKIQAKNKGEIDMYFVSRSPHQASNAL